MRKFSVIFGLLFSLVSIFAVSNSVKADDANDKSYSVQAVVPKSQLNKEVSYYDIKLDPAKSENLELMIANTGSKSIKVKTEINNAYTTDSATIGYDKFNQKTYGDNPSLTSLVEGKRSLVTELDPGQVKTVSFKVTAPKNEFNGIILGGITTTAMVNSSSSKKVDVANQIRYVKGVVLHSKEGDVQPNMHMLKANPRVINDTNGISYALDNLAPINVNDVSIKAVISRKKMKDIKYDADKLQIAPDSKFNYFIPIEHLKPGIYSTKLTISSKNGYSKTFTNKLKITQGSIDALNESTQESSTGKGLLIIVGILIFILILGLWLFMYFTGRRVGFKRRD